MEEVTITLYGVRLCGFYDDKEEHQFASLSESMRSLLEWTKTLDSIGESSTYSPDEDADVLRAFCLDIRELGNGKYLVVTWNELAKVEEGVQVLQVNSKIGEADISAVEMDPLSLPGYPAYFCVDARRKKVLNFRFDQRLNGSRQFQQYMAGFLSGFSDWCVWNEADDEELLGYSDDDELEIAEGVVAKFATTLSRVSAEIDLFRDRCDEIRKMVRRAVVDPEIEAHKTFLDSAFKLAGLPVNNRLKADINFQYEFKTRLTPEKLEGVIAAFDDHAVGDTWSDVGFVFARESQKIYWMSGSVARDVVQIPVNRSDSGMIDIDSFVEYLEGNLQGHFDNLNG